MSVELIKNLCTDFYRWWHNQPGSNTDQGFYEWFQHADVQAVIAQTFTANQRLERLTARLDHLQALIAESLLSDSNPAKHIRHDDYYVGLVAGHHVALEVVTQMREIIDPLPDAED